MGTMKTPGVYIVEKNAFPNSAVEVATAVPAFIGYTEKAQNGNVSLKNKPFRITSMAEYNMYFGLAPTPHFTLSLSGADETPDLECKNNKFTVKQTGPKFTLYYNMLMFFGNGGGPCYIVSVGDYNVKEISSDDLKNGIATLEREQEPTMLICPEAVNLLDKELCFSVQTTMLSHCGYTMQNRVSILDIYDGYKGRKDGNIDIITDFREKIGSSFLSYGAAYYPWLNTSIIQDRDISLKNFSWDDMKKWLVGCQEDETSKGYIAGELEKFDSDWKTASPKEIVDGILLGIPGEFKTGVTDSFIKAFNTDKLNKVIEDISADDFEFLGSESSKKAVVEAIVAQSADAIEKEFDPIFKAAIENQQIDILTESNILQLCNNICGTYESIISYLAETVTDIEDIDSQKLSEFVELLASKVLTMDAETLKKEITSAFESVIAEQMKKIAKTDVINAITSELDKYRVVGRTEFIADIEKNNVFATALGKGVDNSLAEFGLESVTNAGTLNLLSSVRNTVVKVINETTNLSKIDREKKLFAQVNNVLESHKYEAKAVDIIGFQNTLMQISSLYISLTKEVKRQLNLLPLSAAMAGIYTMIDNTRGVWKAPANVSINSAIAPAVNIMHAEQEDLNVPLNGKSINAIRVFVGEGIKVWGARTLDGNSLDWRYINVRRTMIMLEESIKNAARAYVFEPNVASTWVNIKSMIQNFLNGVWKRGGLAGASPDDAFSVHVGLGDTMTPEDILEGILRVTVLVAMVRPAEFIEITFQQQMQKN